MLFQRRALSRTIIVMIAVIAIVVAAVGIYVYQIITTPSSLKDTLIIGTTDSIDKNIDPAEVFTYFGWSMIGSTGSGLLDIRPGSSAGPADYVPILATDWSVSSDGLTYTFNLRQGVEYDDGTEFNATHVKYTIERGTNLNLPEGPYVGMGYSDIIDSIEVASKYQVKFHLKGPYAPFLALMAFKGSFMVNPKYAPVNETVDFVDGNARASSPLDLGPYILTKWVRAGGKDSEMRLDANPNYWNASGGYPKTKHIIYKFYSDPTTLRLAIEGGEIDVAFRQLTATDIGDLENKPDLKVWQGPGAFIELAVLQLKGFPFNNTDIRRAVAAAINRTSIVSTVFRGQAEPLYSIIPGAMGGHIDAFKTLGDANYTFVRNTLAPLGYNDNNKLVIDYWYESSGHYQASPQLASVIKSSIEASGVITVNLHSLDWAAYWEAVSTETMSITIFGDYGDVIELDAYCYAWLHSEGSSWTHDNYNSPQMDRLIEWARYNTSAETRLGLYEQIQELMATDVPIIPLFQSASWAVTKKNVEGVVLDITQAWRPWLLYATEG